MVRKLRAFLTNRHARIQSFLEGIDDAALPSFAISSKRIEIRSQGFRIKQRLRLRSAKTALICPPTEPGSLGDEAMIQSLVDQLINQGFRVDLLVNDEQEDWESIIGIEKKVLLKRFEEDTSHYKLFSNYNSFYLIGADVLDGKYDKRLSEWLIWTTWIASVNCPNVTITGFSFNNSPEPSVVTLFKLLPKKVRLCCRDEHSCTRFKKFVGKSPIKVADLAFLLKPSANSGQGHLSGLSSWLNKNRRLGRKNVGVNVSWHSFVLAAVSDEPERVIKLFRTEIESLVRDYPVSITLVPHDFKGRNSDLYILKSLYTSLNAETKKWVRLLEPPYKASNVKYITQELDLVFTGRMHLAIASLGSGTPVVCVVYQDKFEGMLDYFNLAESSSFSAKQILKPNTIRSIIVNLLDSQDLLEKDIRKSLPAVLRLAGKNIVGQTIISKD